MQRSTGPLVAKVVLGKSSVNYVRPVPPLSCGGPTLEPFGGCQCDNRIFIEKGVLLDWVDFSPVPLHPTMKYRQ